MPKQQVTRIGNVIHVNFANSEIENPRIRELYRSDDPMEMTMAHYWNEKEFIKAARLAQELSEHKLKGVICDEGIMHLHRQLVKIRRSTKHDDPARIMSIAVSYNELSQLHSIKGNDGTAESYTRLSREAWRRASMESLKR
jgi:hypothetical protein